MRHLLITPTLLSLSVLALSGCGSDDKDETASTNTPPATTKACTTAGSDGVRTCTLNATSTTAYTYLSLKDGDVVALSDSAAKTSGAWDLAFKRDAVISNSGTSGTGNRALNLAAKQADFYEADGVTPIAAKFTAATSANTLSVLTGSLTIPSNSRSWTADSLSSALAPAYTGTYPNPLDYGWFTYNPTNHTLTPNTNKGWLLRSAEGNSYARFRVNSVSNVAGANNTDFAASFDFNVQVKDTVQFSTNRTWNVTLATGSSCYDFDAGTEVTTCTGNAWDVKVTYAGRSAALSTNSGVTGSGQAGAFGPHVWTGDLATYTSATTAPTGAAIPSNVYVADSSSSLIGKNWYAYDLGLGNHLLYPNYRVYLLNSNTTDSASTVYAVQITNFYGGTAGSTSGHITLRYRTVAR